MNPERYLKKLNKKKYYFLDFGCSRGDSMIYAKKQFGMSPGLGIDTAKVKIEGALERGLDAIHYNIFDLPSKKLVKFVLMIHFLEHIPNTNDVEKFIKKGAEMSSDFILIRQPFFDADSYLFEHGLKMFWSDWNNHPNRMTTLEMYLVLRDLMREGLFTRFSLHHRTRVVDSSHSSIIPINTPKHSFDYDPEKHPPKEPIISFKIPVYRELVAVISHKQCNHEKLLEVLPFHNTAYKSWE